MEAFAGCSTILHAGDLTNSGILSVFKEKEVHAVSGNMCSLLTRQSLPEQKTIVLGGHTIGITHGAGPRHNIEERVFNMFPDASCIVFGHTHQPLCETWGKTLLLNPGSFRGTGRYGALGTYAILKIAEQGIQGQIHFLKS